MAASFHVDYDGVDSTAIAYVLYGPGIECWREQNFPHSYTPALGTTQTPIKWALGRSLGVKWLGCCVKHPLPSSVEVK